MLCAPLALTGPIVLTTAWQIDASVLAEVQADGGRALLERSYKLSGETYELAAPPAAPPGAWPHSMDYPRTRWP